MKTLVYPPPGVGGLGRSRTVGVIANPLSDSAARLVLDALAQDGIPLAVRAGGTVHLYAIGPLTTAQEVRALRAFAAVTDARLAWHKAVA